MRMMRGGWMTEEEGAGDMRSLKSFCLSPHLTGHIRGTVKRVLA